MSLGPKDGKSRTSIDPREARLAKALRDNLRRRKVAAGEIEAQAKSDKIKH